MKTLSKFLAAGSVAALTMVAPQKMEAQQESFNLDIKGMTDNYAQTLYAPGSLLNGATVAANTSFDVYFLNLDPANAGSSTPTLGVYSVLNTSLGTYNSATNYYTFSTLADNTGTILSLNSTVGGGQPYAEMYSSILNNSSSLDTIASYKNFFGSLDLDVQKNIDFVSPAPGVSGYYTGYSIDSVPEPSTLALAAIGGCAVAFFSRREKNSPKI